MDERRNKSPFLRFFILMWTAVGWGYIGKTPRYSIRAHGNTITKVPGMYLSTRGYYDRGRFFMLYISTRIYLKNHVLILFTRESDST